MNNIINNIRKELSNNADEQTKVSGKRFFKEDVKLYGVKTAMVSKIGKQYDKEIKAMDKAEVFALCEELFKSGMMEEAFIACHWSNLISKNFEEKDFAVLENWVHKYIDNWAECDTLCNHTVAAFVEKFPPYISKLKEWTQSDNRWIKRASAVTLIIPARHGNFLNDIFEIADKLLMDKDDMVQKGYGWMLKAASESHQKEVFEYVMKHKDKMPRTALRYAIEKMPQELKKKAMER